MIINKLLDRGDPTPQYGLIMSMLGEKGHLNPTISVFSYNNSASALYLNSFFANPVSI
jgi:hypothetical protein